MSRHVKRRINQRRHNHSFLATNEVWNDTGEELLHQYLLRHRGRIKHGGNYDWDYTEDIPVKHNSTGWKAQKKARQYKQKGA